MRGNDFVTNPEGDPGKTGGGQPSSYNESRPTKTGQDPDINPNEIPGGGKDLYADPKAPDTGNPIGTGTPKSPGKPFKVS